MQKNGAINQKAPRKYESPRFFKERGFTLGSKNELFETSRQVYAKCAPKQSERESDGYFIRKLAPVRVFMSKLTFNSQTRKMIEKRF